MRHSEQSSGSRVRVLERHSDAVRRSLKKAVLVRDFYYAVALLMCIGLTVHVFQNVPLDTVLPGSGRRGSNGNRVPYVMCMPPIVAVMIWRVFRRRPLRQGKNALVRRYVLAGVIPALLVVGQAGVAHSLFEAAGLTG